MKFIYVGIVLLISFPCFSQDSIQYFDKNWYKVASKESATYYRKTRIRAGVFIVRDYFLSNNQLQMEAECTSVEPEIIYEGRCTRYFKNGNKEEEGFYRRDQKLGLWTEYHSSGGKKSEISYEDKERAKYHQCWDEGGQALLVDGNGVISFDNSTAEIRDSLLWSCFRVQGRDSIYTVVEKTAEYKGGMAGFYQSLRPKLTYPKKARRSDIEGRVFVQFIVSKEGSVRDATVVKGIGGGCDEEALRAVQTMNDWTPATNNGQVVLQTLVLPVMFKLN